MAQGGLSFMSDKDAHRRLGAGLPFKRTKTFRVKPKGKRTFKLGVAAGLISLVLLSTAAPVYAQSGNLPAGADTKAQYASMVVPGKRVGINLSAVAYAGVPEPIKNEEKTEVFDEALIASYNERSVIKLGNPEVGPAQILVKNELYDIEITKVERAEPPPQKDQTKFHTNIEYVFSDGELKISSGYACPIIQNRRLVAISPNGTISVGVQGAFSIDRVFRDNHINNSNGRFSPSNEVSFESLWKNSVRFIQRYNGKTASIVDENKAALEAPIGPAVGMLGVLTFTGSAFIGILGLQYAFAKKNKQVWRNQADGFEVIFEDVKELLDEAYHTASGKARFTHAEDYNTVKQYIKLVKFAIDNPNETNKQIGDLDLQISIKEKKFFKSGLSSMQGKRDFLKKLRRTFAGSPDLTRFATALDMIYEAIKKDCIAEHSSNRYVLEQAEEIIKAYTNPQQVADEIRAIDQQIFSLRESKKLLTEHRISTYTSVRDEKAILLEKLKINR